MRLTMFTVGSRGDVQPFVALGVALQGAGFDVTVATHEPFEAFVTSRGLRFAALPGDPAELLLTDAARDLVTSGVGLISFARRFVSILEPWFWDLVRAVTPLHAAADAVLYSALAFPVWHLAQIDRTPTIQLTLQPLLPTGAFPAITSGWRDLGPIGNRLTHSVNQQLFWQPMRHAVNTWRSRDLGLPSQGLRGPYGELDDKEEPILHGFSTHLVPRPADWPSRATVTGHWRLIHPSPLPEPTRDFIEGGEPPIYIGFGSIRDGSADLLAEIAVDASIRSGHRLVLGTGWAGLSAAETEQVHVVGDVDHAALFPEMRAVIHHGGAGTTHTAVASGVPSMAVPYFADQPFWGRRLFELGVGAEPVPRQQLDAERLASRIRLLDRDATRVQAKRLGKLVDAEDGVDRAVAAVIRHLSRD